MNLERITMPAESDVSLVKVLQCHIKDRLESIVGIRESDNSAYVASRAHRYDDGEEIHLGNTTLCYSFTSYSIVLQVRNSLGSVTLNIFDPVNLAMVQEPKEYTQLFFAGALDLPFSESFCPNDSFEALDYVDGVLCLAESEGWRQKF